MSAIDNFCLLPTDVPSLPGPECSVYAPNPNASFAQQISNCCNGAQVHYIGNGTAEVPIERSCISWCSYPALAGNDSVVSAVTRKWRECIGVSPGAKCQVGQNGSDSGAAPGGPVALLGSGGGLKGAVLLATVLVLPWVASAVVAV
ncbi:hypothetical protein A4X13_0g3547 [Tilletia indica]|uniref:Uncharacterized protein n=1 Tax=Tilletia indica TaxID=43049 RepID=A0A177TUB3_9BASI|nr:hypothetical protein A4X13_0g3547 [Tilletia indica]